MGSGHSIRSQQVSRNCPWRDTACKRSVFIRKRIREHPQHRSFHGLFGKTLKFQISFFNPWISDTTTLSSTETATHSIHLMNLLQQNINAWLRYHTYYSNFIRNRPSAELNRISDLNVKQSLQLCLEKLLAPLLTVNKAKSNRRNPQSRNYITINIQYYGIYYQNILDLASPIGEIRYA